ncbi:MAG: polysaccharide pyruvyl transferase family protein [Verrucomicrobiota bacterium]
MDTQKTYLKWLSRFSGKSAYIKPYWGNSGDELITIGTKEILAHLGVGMVDTVQDVDLVISPGGNPSMWSVHQEQWRNAWKRFPGVPHVVGPATFVGQEKHWIDALNSDDSNTVAVFARDFASFNNLKSHVKKADIHIGFGDDPSFFLRNSDWLKLKKKALPESEYDLYAFRRDKERLEDDQKDLSGSVFHAAWKKWGALKNRYWKCSLERVESNANDFPRLDVDVSDMSYDLFLETIQYAREVHTDRLHCLIYAALLGKRAYGYPTRYSKLERVYAASMRGRYEVVFVNSTECTGWE